MSETEHNINVHKAIEALRIYMEMQEENNGKRFTQAEAMYHFCVLLNETCQLWIKHFMAYEECKPTEALQAFADFLSNVTMEELAGDETFMDTFKAEVMEDILREAAKATKQ